jgi:hypothetical protein
MALGQVLATLPRTVPFAYYQRLSKKARRIYDASDAITRIDLGDKGAAEAACGAVQAALAAADKRALKKASQALANAICDDRQVPRVEIRVLAKRPKDDQEELHGLYVREDDGSAVIRVWMRTAERRDVVKPKTYLHTLLHEVVHHLDYDLLKLADSLHTEGFYKRENSLFKQVAGELAKTVRPRWPRAETSTPPLETPVPDRPVQLSLFDS